MPADLILICHASTVAVRRLAFPRDEPLDDQGVEAAGNVTVNRVGPAWCSPSNAARQTASGLGLDATVADAIRDCDFGGWAGRAVADVARDEPDAFRAWMTDPRARPHGGEAFAEVFARVGSWVDTRRQSTCLAVTHPAVIRAAIVYAIEASFATFWHLDVGPLSQTWLRSDGTRWTLRSLGGSL